MHYYKFVASSFY